MRNLFFLLLLSAVSGFLSAQATDHDLVRATVQAYLDGTSYNRADLLEDSFHENISMYFSKRGEHWQPTREEYIGFFRNDKTGQPTGRVGNIRLIEVSGDVATAKAEVLIPAQKWLFIDYFLLKKIEGKWWIVSKTASSGPTIQHGGRILMAVSNANTYGDTDLPTGNHFGEIASAYHEFVEAGFTVDFVSPEGGPVAVNYLYSVDDANGKYLRDAEFWYRLNHTLPASELSAQDYAAIYFPGGGAIMFGVADHPDVQRLIAGIYENNGAVAAVCHGTAGITNVTLSNGEPLLKGKTLTGFPDALEKKDEAYYATFPFTIDGRVSAQGGTLQSKPQLNLGFMVTDGRLVTGMDHSATTAVARKVVEIVAPESTTSRKD